MYTTPADARVLHAQSNAEIQLSTQCEPAPGLAGSTKGELNVLFNNRAAIGGFDESGSELTGWYWSGTESDYGIVEGQRFSNGYQGWDDKTCYDIFVASLRCVRG